MKLSHCSVCRWERPLPPDLQAVTGAGVRWPQRRLSRCCSARLGGCAMSVLGRTRGRRRSSATAQAGMGLCTQRRRHWGDQLPRLPPYYPLQFHARVSLFPASAQYCHAWKMLGSVPPKIPHAIAGRRGDQAGSSHRSVWMHLAPDEGATIVCSSVELYGVHRALRAIPTKRRHS